MKVLGVKITESKGSAYCSPTYFDTYNQYVCYMYLFVHGASKKNRVNTIRLSNIYCEYMDITIESWEEKVYDVLMSKAFYTYIKDKGYRWIVLPNGLPILEGQVESPVSNRIERSNDIYAGKPIGKQIESVLNVCTTGINGLCMHVEYLSEATINEKIYRKWILFDWIVELDKNLDWDSIQDQLYSINCENAINSKSFVQYKIKNDKLIPMLWIENKYEVSK